MDELLGFDDLMSESSGSVDISSFPLSSGLLGKDGSVLYGTSSFDGALAVSSRVLGILEGNQDRNMFEYWYPRIRDLVPTPLSHYIPISLDLLTAFYVLLDNRSDYNLSLVNDYILRQLEGIIDINAKTVDLVLKLGNFSNKFDFKYSHITSLGDLGSGFYNIFYSSMAMSVPPASSLVIRGYISPVVDVPTIYEGLPLREEVRVFLDFDNRCVLGISDYWHPEYMTSLAPYSVTSSMGREKLDSDVLASKTVLILNHLGGYSFSIDGLDSSGYRQFALDLGAYRSEYMRSRSIVDLSSDILSCFDYLSWYSWYKSRSRGLRTLYNVVSSAVDSLLDRADLTGCWSVDFMIQPDSYDFYLIDMAEMGKSALVDVMEDI